MCDLLEAACGMCAQLSVLERMLKTGALCAIDTVRSCAALPLGVSALTSPLCSLQLTPLFASILSSHHSSPQLHPLLDTLLSSPQSSPQLTIQLRSILFSLTPHLNSILSSTLRLSSHSPLLSPHSSPQLTPLLNSLVYSLLSSPNVTALLTTQLASRCNSRLCSNHASAQLMPLLTYHTLSPRSPGSIMQPNCLAASSGMIDTPCCGTGSLSISKLMMRTLHRSDMHRGAILEHACKPQLTRYRPRDLLHFDTNGWRGNLVESSLAPMLLVAHAW